MIMALNIILTETKRRHITIPILAKKIGIVVSIDNLN